MKPQYPVQMFEELSYALVIDMLRNEKKLAGQKVEDKKKTLTAKLLTESSRSRDRKPLRL